MRENWTYFPNCTINEQSGTWIPRQPEETKENQTEWQIIEKRRRNFNKHSYNNPTQENKFREVTNNLRSRGNIIDVMTTGSQSKQNQGQWRPKHKTQESRDINQKNAFAVLEDDLPGNFQSTGKMVEENHKKTNQTDNAYTAQEANSAKNTWSSMDVDKECMQKEFNIEFKYYTQVGNASNAQQKECFQNMDPCKVAWEKEKGSNLLKDLNLPQPETFQPPPPPIPDKNCLDSGALSASSTNPKTLQINITPYPFNQHKTSYAKIDSPSHGNPNTKLSNCTNTNYSGNNQHAKPIPIEKQNTLEKNHKSHHTKISNIQPT